MLCVFFQRLVTYNPFFAFSVAVKKARFVCEDGSYMGRIGKITMEDGSFTHLIHRFVFQLSFSDYRIYTSEILTRGTKLRLRQAAESKFLFTLRF